MEQVIIDIFEQAKFNLRKDGFLDPIALTLKDGEVKQPMVLTYEDDSEKYGSYLMVGITARMFFNKNSADRVVFVMEAAMKFYDEATQKLYKEDPELYAPLTFPESQRQDIIMFPSFDLIKKTDCFYTCNFKKKDSEFVFEELKEVGVIKGNLRNAFYEGFNGDFDVEIL